MRSDTAGGLVDQHLAWMRLRDLSPTTVRTRTYLLARTQRAILAPLAEATRADLRVWQELRRTQIEPSALRAEMTGLRCFYRWMVADELRIDDPSPVLLFPRAPRRQPKPMPEPDVALALAQAAPAMRAILALAAMAGLRACEIARLDWSEVDDGAEAMVTVVEGKGGHTRVVEVPVELVAILRALPDRSGPVIRRADGARGHALPHNISHRANRYLHRLGVRHTLHSLRHRTATIAYEETHDIVAVKELLGHASLVTTGGYTKGQASQRRAAATALGRIAS